VLVDDHLHGDGQVSAEVEVPLQAPVEGLGQVEPVLAALESGLGAVEVVLAEPELDDLRELVGGDLLRGRDQDGGLVAREGIRRSVESALD
jgi:hypothetical protein